MLKVALLMPTMPGRERFIGRAVISAAQQKVPADWQVTLLIDAERGTLGAKINRMVESSNADYFVLLDDDDYHSPARVQHQVEPLIDGLHYSGTSKIFYHDTKTDKAYLFSCPPDAWLGGLAFTRAIWRKIQFEDETKGVDVKWQRAVQALHLNEPCFCDLADPALFIASMHDTNSGGEKKVTNGDYWKQVSIAELGEFPRV